MVVLTGVAVAPQVAPDARALAEPVAPQLLNDVEREARKSELS